MYHSLNDRIFTTNAIGRGRTKPVSSRQTENRPAEYKEWDEISMIKAMTAVEHGTSLRQASELYGVPRSTLHDRVSGKVQHGTRAGRPSYLTPAEEGELVNFLFKCSDIGYPHTVAQVLSIVQQIIDDKGMNQEITRGWWHHFSLRHPGISLRTCSSFAMSRAKATDYSTLDKYYDILENTLKMNNLYNNPGRIYNCDETGVPLNPKSFKVVAKAGTKSVGGVRGDDKAQITVLACTCANGTAIPPFVIFDRKTLNPDLTTGEIPGTIYGLSANGWINRELFMNWFFHHFLMCVPPVRPILLLLDGHSSHYSPDVIRVAAEERVILFALPPNTTHLTQPLDKGCFSPFKAAWRKTCQEFYTHNPGRVVTRYDFSSLFSEAWKSSMSQKNVLGGFKTTGIYPFDRNKLLSRLQPQQQQQTLQFRPEALPKSTGIQYIPFYGSAPPSLSSEVYSLDRSFSENDVRRSTSPAMIFRKSTTASKFLNTPLPPCKIPVKRPKSSGKVLTSHQNVMEMQEKERMKEEQIKKKEERKLLREAKAREKSLRKNVKKQSKVTEGQ